MRKYKRFRFHKTRANLFLRKLARENADLFVRWQTVLGLCSSMKKSFTTAAKEPLYDQ